MDDYPEHLAPEFDEGGGVVTPFEKWWPRVAASFPTVPEAVARYWLHEHWRHSPYSHLKSRDYRFSLAEWPAADLWKVHSRWCNFCPDNLECAEHGAYLTTLVEKPYAYRTAIYMLANGDFPTPIIVLDNRDGHAIREKFWESVPRGWGLIEGHRRFNLALHLQRTGHLKPAVKVWVMKRTGADSDG
ncbi:hypothetical protein [Reyranella sp.]|jgi:hypothetical protein|uniref:hypothetical protein n=1 Tax=Reyranella sp. TaxID=1929291 RepID=UPI00262AF06D|nr:hypothetical protein [Reyranella sp.]HQS15463.1 hypothetical protein [Reyranella sp.]HQT11989.1 hypothetical protein [Reyranella sp.]